MQNPKKVFVSIFVSAMIVLLTACTQDSSLPASIEEIPLFTDSDLDNAKLEPAARQVDMNSVAFSEMLEEPSQESVIAPQGVLPGASGFVYYYQFDPSKADPYRIFKYDQATNIKTLVYQGKREIESVAGTLIGNVVVASMRETTSSASDYEIFRLTGTTSVSQLTSNSVNDTHISTTRGQLVSLRLTYTIAWETGGTHCEIVGSCHTSATHRYIRVRTVNPVANLEFIVDNGNGTFLIQPSISGNGRYLALVSGRSVHRYTFSTKSFTFIVGGLIPPQNPSISDDGLRVAYYNLVNQKIGLYDNGSLSTIVDEGVYSHPHLTADGKWLTYAVQVNGAFRIKTRNLLTNVETNLTQPVSPVFTNAPFWQKANP